MTALEYAEKWFILHDIPTVVTDEDIYIQTQQGFELQLSTEEVEYRAELYLESELHRVKFNNE